MAAHTSMHSSRCLQHAPRLLPLDSVKTSKAQRHSGKIPAPGPVKGAGKKTAAAVGDRTGSAQRGARSTMAAVASEASPTASAAATSTLLCTSLTAPTVDGMLAEAAEAVANGADIVELRLDFLQIFNPEADLRRLLAECPLPAIVTFRPAWEG
jgi:hypothetical protein